MLALWTQMGDDDEADDGDCFFSAPRDTGPSTDVAVAAAVAVIVVVVQPGCCCS